jgi:hypothetical protein
MNGRFVREHFPHVAEVAPVIATARVPENNVDVLQERVVQMLRGIQVKKIAKMMIHVHASVQLDQKRRLVYDYIAFVGLDRIFSLLLEMLEFSVP